MSHLKKSALNKILMVVGGVTLIFLLILSGLFLGGRRYYNHMESVVGDREVTSYIEAWVRKQNLAVESPNYALGGFSGGTWVASFDWKKLGFSEFSHIRAWKDLNSNSIVALGFDEGKGWGKLVIVYDVSGRGLNVGGSIKKQNGRFYIVDFY